MRYGYVRDQQSQVLRERAQALIDDGQVYAGEALLHEGLYVNLARLPATPANMTLLRCSLCSSCLTRRRLGPRLRRRMR